MVHTLNPHPREEYKTAMRLAESCLLLSYESGGRIAILGLTERSVVVASCFAFLVIMLNPNIYVFVFINCATAY